jgi:hypothetical protein
LSHAIPCPGRSLGNHGKYQCSPFVHSARHVQFLHLAGDSRAFSKRYETFFDYFDNNLGKIVENSSMPRVLLLDTIDAHVYP